MQHHLLQIEAIAEALHPDAAVIGLARLDALALDRQATGAKAKQALHWQPQAP